jgi:hypothetical protein
VRRPRFAFEMGLDRAAPLACAKLHSLRKRQLARKIDRVRLAPHVALPTIAATLASAARILFATERAADFRAAGSGINVRDSAITSDRT